MELDLGLALPIQNPVKKESKQIVGLELWDPSSCLDSKKLVKNKRTFGESIGCSLGSEGLSLLVWSGQPNEEDDRSSGKKNKSTSTKNQEEEEEDQVVGWPPIKAWRMKKLHQRQERYNVRNDRRAAMNGGRRRSNSMFVKVKMEGVAIGRKIDLRLYSSYQSLTTTLITMFANYRKFEEGANYTLIYQDEEGDWLLAGDHVPWQSFINSVQRLEILRDGNETT